MTEGTARFLHRVLVPTVLVLLVVACYSKILDTFFVQDDFFMLAVAQRPGLQLAMLRGVCFLRPLPTYWLPKLNLCLWGLNAYGHHLTYLVMFIATVLILYYWLHNVTDSVPAAFLGAAMYGLSKTHLYTLAWIAGGIDISAALFFVVSLWAIDRFLRQSDEGVAHNRQMLWMIGVAYGCSLLCKESCVVLGPACLAWIVVRKLTEHRPFKRAELTLATLLVLILVAYIPAWKLTNLHLDSSTGGMQFDVKRGLEVLQDSVIAIIPASEASLPATSWWLAIPLIMSATVAILNRNSPRKTALIALGLSLWILPACIFVVTKYPWMLQLYYAHFSVIGLVTILALAVESAIAACRRFACSEGIKASSHSGTRYAKLRLATSYVAAVLVVAWLGLACQTIQSGVRDRASPALLEADVAKAFYEQLNAHLSPGGYEHVILLNVSNLTWASMQYGVMLQVLFPQVRIVCDGRNGFVASKGLKSSPAALVLRQVGGQNLTVVR